MAQDKKPVWADQEAHGILKRWASLQKRHMVDVASELLLEKLPLLEGGEAASAAAAAAPAAPKEAAAPSAPEAPAKEPAEVKTPAGEPAAAASAEPAGEVAPSQETADSPSRTEVRTVDKPTSGVRPMTDKETTFLGGVWLV